MIRFGEIVTNAAPTRRRHASPASADALAVPIVLTTGESGEPARRRGPATARWVVAVDIMSGLARTHARTATRTLAITRHRRPPDGVRVTARVEAVERP